MKCQYCHKTYKTERGLKNHQQRIEKCNGKLSLRGLIHKSRLFPFLDLPKFIQGMILDELDVKDILKLRQAMPHIFGYDHNDYWQDRCRRDRITFKRNLLFKSWGLTWLSLKQSLCIKCLQQTYRQSVFFEFPLCGACQKQDVRCKMVCKSRAKSEYYLNDEDLEDIQSIFVDNPHYRSASKMELFLLNDIQNLARKKYGDFQAEKEKREARKTKLAETRKSSQEKRREELAEALGKIGLEIRNDSWLCRMWINGQAKRKDLELDWVVNRMAMMKWLHEYTDYRKILRETIRMYRYEGYYRYDQREVSQDAEDTVLRRRGRPKVWPWLANPPIQPIVA